jgi:hypothetical protein
VTTHSLTPVAAGLAVGICLIAIFSFTFKPLSTKIATPSISQEQAIKIVDNDLRQRLVDYRSIERIIVNNTSGYVSIEEFRSKNMILPLVYVSPSGQLVLLNSGINETAPGQKNLGFCTSPLDAYCGFLPHFNFDYRGKVVYGIEVIASYDDAYGVPFLYIVDGVDGDIVDSTFLRDEKIRSLTHDE